ncbi:MAG: hypothetical protein WA395_13355 [Nitrososphaeraceae archaeon]
MIERRVTNDEDRVIFSLVHEIGQALFLNFGLTIRNRLKMSKRDSLEARKFRAMIYEEQPYRKRPL